MLDRVGRRARGLSARLAASYILVTLTAVVLVEALTLGFQVPSLVNGAQLQAQVAAAAKSYGQQLARRYPRGVPAGTLLGDPGQPAKLGMIQPTLDRTLVFPAITGPIPRKQGVTAVVAIATDGTVVASSAPSRYPPGRAAASELPVQAAQAITGPHIHLKGGGVPTPYGNVIFWMFGPEGHADPNGPPTSVPGLADYVYVQAPWSPPGFINPVHAWDELRQLGEDGPLLVASYVLLFAIVPVGVLFGLLASWRLVRRVRRLERATLAVADGDYTVSLPVSGRDEVGRLEANFTTMTRQLGSALAAERQRATGDARTAERARIAREVHDAISQHLFGLRMIAAGMRRADPGNQQARVIEQISEEALRDMQVLLIELRPASLDGGGLTPALQEICAAYHDRLGITVDASLDNVTVPAPVEHALLRITQEACTNAVRHGHARRLAVSLTRRDGHVELAVRDTGTGFDPATPHTGSGLAHIRDRVAELGGTIDIDSAPGLGAALTVRVPVP
jgi:signal transduction histidine kinase